MKVFITGATGFIGSVVLEKLIQDPKIESIIALSRQGLQAPKVEVIRADLLDYDKYKESLLSVDAVIHIAAKASFNEKNFDYKKVNTDPVREMVSILKDNGSFKKFIFISSIGAFDRHPSDDFSQPISNQHKPFPRSEYGSSKLEAERILQESKLPYVIIRPSWVWGAEMRDDSHLKQLALMVENRALPSKFNFPGKVSLIHVDDLAKGIHGSLQSDIMNECYFAGTESLSLGEIFSIYRKNKNPKASQISLPSLGWLFKLLHTKLPLSVNNLFLSYLHCVDGPYCERFQLQSIKSFKDNYREIVMSLNKKGHYVITGANSGIGLALARKLKGEALVLVDKKIDIIEKEFSDSMVIACDLSQEDELSKLVEILRPLKIKSLINNAGVGFKGGASDLALNESELMVDVNIKAPLYLVQSLIHQLKKQGSSIVNVASSVAFNPLPGMSVYAASKAFVLSWTEALAVELKDTNTVICFCPSGTKTSFQKDAGVKVNRDGKGLLSPDDVAEKIIGAIHKEKSQTYLLGLAGKILNLVGLFLPRSYNAKLWGKLFESSR